MNQSDDDTVTRGLNTLNVSFSDDFFRNPRPLPDSRKESIEIYLRYSIQVTHKKDIRVHTFPTGRGICSTESTYKGDSVFVVHDVITPRHIFENSPQLVDSISKAQDEDNIYSILDEIREKNIVSIRQRVESIFYSQKVQLTIRDLLIIWLLTEKKNKDSKYFGYIQSLPDTSTCPFRGVFKRSMARSGDSDVGDLKCFDADLQMLVPDASIKR